MTTSCLRVMPLLAVGLLLGSTAVAEPADRAFDRDAWRRGVEARGLAVENVVYPFESTPEMDEWVQRTVGGSAIIGDIQKLVRIQEAMFEGDSFDFAYDGAQTLTASQAFDSGRGNCLAFTSLFIALSRSAGLPTRMMSVTRTPRVEREDDLVVINRHVVASYRSNRGVVTFDFNLSSEEQLIRSRVLDDLEASAMFHNNLGADALRDGDLRAALRHFEITTALWPEWTVGWVNRGVTLAQSGETHSALESYSRALEIDPRSASALNNMAHLYLDLGLEHEALVARRAAAKTTDNPFTLLALAESEYQRGHVDEARRYLRRAKRWYSREPEVYRALATMAERLGDSRRAARYEAKADKLQASAENP